MKKYTKTYNVILDNMDLTGYRLRPISAIMYLQDAFARFTATKKLAAYDLFSKNLYWVVAEFNMDFLEDLPFWSEEIKIEVWFSEISKLKIYIDFNIYYKNKIFSKGNALWFLIDKNTGRPARADIVSERFEVCRELVSGEHKKTAFPVQTEVFKQISHTNNFSDIDFNNHVNNKSYINLAEMTVPEEFKKTHTLRNLHIRFNKETYLGDILTCKAGRTETDNTITHVIEKDGIPVCEIATVWSEGVSSENIVESELEVKSEGE